MNILLLLITILLTSCSTTEIYDGAAVYGPRCTTKIELKHGTKFETPIDEDNFVAAEAGCVRKYGPKYCLVKFIKVAPAAYHAICGRAKDDGQD